MVLYNRAGQARLSIFIWANDKSTRSTPTCVCASVCVQREGGGERRDVMKSATSEKDKNERITSEEWWRK